MSIGDRPFPIALHHITNRVGIALKMLFHGFEGGNSLRHGVGAQGLGVELLSQALLLGGSLFYFFFRPRDIGVNGRDLGVISRNGSFFAFALLAQILGDTLVFRKFPKRRAVFVGIGILGVFQYRNTHLDIYRLRLQGTNILQGLRHGRLQLALTQGQQILLLDQRLTILRK